ncbi:hypothetical protein [Cryobacterium gelidum]|uniref:Uncharacterized protein n=1 Tax=Cryobacterium gelidum TaxID=1259164 RepID=A0A4R9AXX0_9MICO|nr:hypothetical protein [Cryobacterium gelidum]TFD71289.1 hypothetical protein E3T50_06855 [Cryobacterium gelidum]
MKTLSSLKRGTLSAAALTAVILTGLTGCATPDADATSGIAAATKEEIAGTDLNRLTLTEKAVERLDLATAPVAAGISGLDIPYGALIYTANGDTWVYTSPEPLVFIRAMVVVDRIDGQVARLSAGPAVGTAVVTVGAAELYGAEFDAAH